MIEQKKKATALMNLTTLLQLDSDSPIERGYGEQFEALVNFVEDLINNDFERLVRTLYRIDVSEQKVRNVLAESNGEESSKLIAQLIIDREVKKIETRERFKK